MKNQQRRVSSSGSNSISSEKESIWIFIVRKLIKNKVAVISLVVFVSICLACALAPLLTRWEYYTTNPSNRFATPSPEHLFGTDGLGRDNFSRILYGGRTTLSIAMIASFASALIGCIIGLPAGYFGKRVDFIISPVLDVLASIPIVLLVIVFESVFGYGRGYFVYAMIISAIPQFARLVRACVMSVTGREYIEASRALGVSHFMIIFKHVLHNITSPLIVRFTSGMGEALLICTIMGYLGIGIQPPVPEWGMIAYIAKESIFTSPHVMIFPCAVITVCVVSLSLFTDGLQEALDPR